MASPIVLQSIPLLAGAPNGQLHQPPLPQRPSGLKRLTNNIGKLARQLVQYLKPSQRSLHSPASPAIASTTRAQLESNRSACAAHALRTVQFPSSRQTNCLEHFPFQISHTYSTGGNTISTLPTLNTLLPELSGALANKQGFVFIYDAAEPSPIEQFANWFQGRNAIDIGEGCKLIGAYRTPRKQASIVSPEWVFQVHDSHMMQTFDVPVTEAPLESLVNQLNRNKQLLHLNDCMDSHLRSIPAAFQDSPESPAILCPELPRLAQLLTAQEECLGQQLRGELKCKSNIDWMAAVNEALAKICPENPDFQGEEGCDVESFFATKSIHTFADKTLPFSIGGLEAGPMHPQLIRGFKRHLPAQVFEANRASHTGINQAAARPSRMFSLAPPTQTTALATLNAAVNKPEWLANRDLKLAYKEPTGQMQCASQAINTVLQSHVATPELVAAHIATSRQGMLQEIGISMNEQRGLMHPKILKALEARQTIQISRNDFLGNAPNALDIGSDESPSASWQKLINSSPQAQGKNWVDNHHELNSISSLEINANVWLSAQRGIETEELLTMLNRHLNSPNKPTHLPPQMQHINLRKSPEQIRQLERQAQNAVKANQDFPVVLRTGGAAGHFHTIVPDSKGNWLSLNSDSTQTRGVQKCQQWCGAGQLGASLKNAGVTDLLVPAQTATI